MNILAIDTATMVSSVAIINDEKLLCEITINSKKNHSEKLILLIDDMIKNCDISINDVDIFTCTIGPGSFTGLRIAISTIKGLAQSLDKPVIGISTLESLAFNLPYADGIICPIIDAQRNNVYTGLYEWENGKLICLLKDNVMEIENLFQTISKMNKNIYITGDAIKKIPQDLIKNKSNNIYITPIIFQMPKGGSLANLALIKAKEGMIQSYTELEPNYIRKSQAEYQLEMKNSKV
ncbi:MAG: tRNA (adenosine(37)-N6)-threonylcarbamoyltransferase complex dimerization subunit type 1 TsaB [Eubacteriaceae bacterium]